MCGTEEGPSRRKADRIRLIGPAATNYPSIFAMLQAFATPGQHAHRLMSRDLEWAFAPAKSSQLGIPSRQSTANYLWTHTPEVPIMRESLFFRTSCKASPAVSFNPKPQGAT